MRDLLTTSFPARSTIEKRTAEAVEKLKALIGRAQAERSIRADLVGSVATPTPARRAISSNGTRSPRSANSSAAADRIRSRLS